MNREVGNIQASQRGAATVESAIIIIAFLMLVMGIIEFALLVFSASSLVEASRIGARYLIVNNTVLDADDPEHLDLNDYSCAELESVTFSCSDASVGCDAILPKMKNYYSNIKSENIQVNYRCSSTGYELSYINVYEVELRLVGIQYKFITPGILGLDATVTLPDITTTRLSEDLSSVN